MIIYIILIIDIVLRFNIGFYKEEIILDRKMIGLNYINTFFISDVITVLPYFIFLIHSHQ